MNLIKENINLKDYNSFKIDVFAKYFIEIQSIEQIKELIGNEIFLNNPCLILGGGNNILFSKDYPGLIVYINNKGINLIKQDIENAYIEFQAGEEWENVIKYCEENNHQGIENLAHIPGKAGSAPVQNIGAYGIEIKDFIDEVKAFDIETKTIKTFTQKQCNFAYRDSIFKKELKNKVIITSIILKLNKQHSYNTFYKDLEKELKNYPTVNISNIIKALYKIRTDKLPDTKLIGNAGSFFKNPIVNAQTFNKLKEKFENLNAHQTSDGNYKISAAWLIEISGCRTIIDENVAIYPKHSLIIINKGKASGVEIINFADKIIKQVNEMFNINLQAEVNII